MAKHITTTDRSGSYCEATEEFDVFSYGADDGPMTLCTGCGEPEADWEIITNEQFDKIYPNV